MLRHCFVKYLKKKESVAQTKTSVEMESDNCSKILEDLKYELKLVQI